MEADAERAMWDLSVKGRGAGREGPLAEALGFGAWNPLLDFFLGSGAGDDPEMEEGVAADASYSSATATICQYVSR